MSETEYCQSVEELLGKTEVKFQCGVAANSLIDEGDPEYCPHEPEDIELDGPVRIDDGDRIHLPGRPIECPECGNPHELRFGEVPVYFP